MLIQFCGSGGTGKTTTKDGFMASEVGQTFKTIPSSARAVSEEWGLKTEDDQENLAVTEFLDFQKAITTRFLGDIAALRSAGENVITERSMIDHVGYTVLKWAKRSASLTCEEENAVMVFQKWMEDTAVGQLRNVDILAFFPAGVFLPPPDHFRTNRETERRAVDAIFRGLCWKYQQVIGGQNFPVATMNVTNPQVRIHHLVSLAERMIEDASENTNTAAVLPPPEGFQS